MGEDGGKQRWTGNVFLALAVALLPLSVWLNNTSQRPAGLTETGPKVLYTLAELTDLGTGQSDANTLLLGILGRVFNVSAGEEFYAKGQGYSVFAGHDCTRAFALTSTKAKWLDNGRPRSPACGPFDAGRASEDACRFETWLETLAARWQPGQNGEGVCNVNLGNGDNAYRAHRLGALRGLHNPDGGLLASGSEDKKVKVFATSTWATVKTHTEHTGHVLSVAFNLDGGLLASGSSDKTVNVFATSTWAKVTTLAEHTDGVRSVAFSPDGGLLATGSLDYTVKVFAASTWAKVTTLTEHTNAVFSVAFNPDGGLLASGGADKTVKVFATSTWATVTTHTEHTDAVSSVAFNPDGGLLASGSWDSTVKVFATSTLAKVTTLTEHFGWVRSVAFSPDGGLLASGSYDSRVSVFASGKYDTGSVSFSAYVVDASGLSVADPSVESCSEGESQLANEMRLFRHIRHSNIVLFHGATLMVINGGSPCLSLVLEWVNGGNFGEYMQQLRSNAVFEADGHAFAYKILLDVARGMTYLHKLTPVILHLDLKPANILVEKSVPPKGKITDFGLSRFARNSLLQHKVGTEKYMAPEVAQRKAYGPAADVFSFGRVIIWTITGELCPELISSTSFKEQEDACLFQTLDEVASSCLEEARSLGIHAAWEGWEFFIRSKEYAFFACILFSQRACPTCQSWDVSLKWDHFAKEMGRIFF
ncbi:unnamed protein product [Polarella glacialis]|uniref:Protein kinase domain-containing protein n=1 Tax=Polarella glacialis TaxID=89957 RepID=A0A813D6V0_POLGL|nr:unnamed protein product [Polarella glacialis]